MAIHEECGVYGICGGEAVASLVYYGLSRSSTEVRNHAESQSMMMLQSIVLREWGS